MGTTSSAISARDFPVTLWEGEARVGPATAAAAASGPEATPAAGAAAGAGTGAGAGAGAVAGPGTHRGGGGSHLGDADLGSTPHELCTYTHFGAYASEMAKVKRWLATFQADADVPPPPVPHSDGIIGSWLCALVSGVRATAGALYEPAPVDDERIGRAVETLLALRPLAGPRQLPIDAFTWCQKNSYGKDPTTTPERLLKAAVERHRPWSVRALLRHGASVKGQILEDALRAYRWSGEDGSTSERRTTQVAVAQVLEALLRHGAAVACRSCAPFEAVSVDWTVMPALVRVAAATGGTGITRIVEVLLRAGAATTAPAGVDGWTLLHDAVQATVPDCRLKTGFPSNLPLLCSMLVKAGCDANAATSGEHNMGAESFNWGDSAKFPAGTTPLHVLATDCYGTNYFGDCSETTWARRGIEVMALRRAGAQTTALDATGSTPLDVVYEHHLRVTSSMRNGFGNHRGPASTRTAAAPAVTASSSSSQRRHVGSSQRRHVGSSQRRHVGSSQRRHVGSWVTQTKWVTMRVRRGASTYNKMVRVTSGRWSCCGNTRRSSTHCGDSDVCSCLDFQTNPVCCLVCTFFVLVFGIIIVVVIASGGTMN